MPAPQYPRRQANSADNVVPAKRSLFRIGNNEDLCEGEAATSNEFGHFEKLANELFDIAQKIETLTMAREPPEYDLNKCEACSPFMTFHKSSTAEDMLRLVY
jgi:hypothetical protein